MNGALNSSDRAMWGCISAIHIRELRTALMRSSTFGILFMEGFGVWKEQP